MKLKVLSNFFIVFFIVFFKTGAFGASEPQLAAPSAFIPESRYTFNPVVDGTKITHDFVIQNKGNAPLKIEKVRTG